MPMGSVDWGYGITRPSIIDRRRMLIASKEEAGESDDKNRGCLGQKSIAQKSIAQKSIARVIPIAPHIKRVTAVVTPLRLERSRKIHAAQTNPMPVTTCPAPVLCVECCRTSEPREFAFRIPQWFKDDGLEMRGRYCLSSYAYKRPNRFAMKSSQVTSSMRTSPCAGVFPCAKRSTIAVIPAAVVN